MRIIILMIFLGLTACPKGSPPKYIEQMHAQIVSCKAQCQLTGVYQTDHWFYGCLCNDEVKK